MTPSTQAQKARKSKLPFHGGQRCYACDCETVVGLRDRRPGGGSLEVACERHTDPTVAIYEACMFCDGPVGRGSLLIDGNFAHKTCHEMASNDTFDAEMERRFQRARARSSIKKRS